MSVRFDEENARYLIRSAYYVGRHGLILCANWSVPNQTISPQLEAYNSFLSFS